MLSVQDQAKANQEKLKKAFESAGVKDLVQTITPQVDRGLMTDDAGRANIDLGFGAMSESINVAADEASNALDMMKEKANAVANNISGTLTNAFSNLFTGLMNGTQSFGEFMKQVLTDLLIKLASMAAAFGEFLKGGFGLTGFAEGGIVSGPTAALVGEYAGARTNPEVIAPLDKLRSMIQGAGGGNVTVTGRLSGSDILLSSERSNIYRNRSRGF